MENGQQIVFVYWAPGGQYTTEPQPMTASDAAFERHWQYRYVRRYDRYTPDSDVESLASSSDYSSLSSQCSEYTAATSVMTDEEDLSYEFAYVTPEESFMYTSDSESDSDDDDDDLAGLY
ncbi:hypothetical protein BROUX41_002856 [Berkeleyomyces rouxiae]|uniref:uncharacterized protein n=1 Tax=Berkeleyomyces rouxiae TaxID=2035830 RepID=UPI003B760A48